MHDAYLTNINSDYTNECTSRTLTEFPRTQKRQIQEFFIRLNLEDHLENMDREL